MWLIQVLFYNLYTHTHARAHIHTYTHTHTQFFSFILLSCHCHTNDISRTTACIFLFPGRIKSTTALSNNSTMGHRLIIQNDEENMKTPDHSVVDTEHRYWSHINRWTNFSTTIYLQFFVRIFCNVRFQSYLSRFYNSSNNLDFVEWRHRYTCTTWNYFTLENTILREL